MILVIVRDYWTRLLIDNTDNTCSISVFSGTSLKLANVSGLKIEIDVPITNLLLLFITIGQWQI